jgi:SAM-dependent methyltransferase
VIGTAGNWVEWWDTETIVTPEIWKTNMETFVAAAEPFLGFGPDDVVLDVGSGPGFLAECVKDRVREIHCVDTSRRYVEVCREKFAMDSNVFFHVLDPDNYTDLSVLEGKKFSIIVCQSVVQYYRSIDEVANLIEEVRRLAQPSAKLLVSDIPITRSLATLTCHLLRTAWRDRRLLHRCRLLFRLATSPCGRAYSSLGLLTLSEAQLRELVQRLKLDAEILSERLTCNDGRRHLFVRF